VLFIKLLIFSNLAIFPEIVLLPDLGKPNSITLDENQIYIADWGHKLIYRLIGFVATILVRNPG
jgi:sugar lactone lactonase YvrE